MTHRRVAAVGLAAGLLLAAGCGGGSVPRFGNVKGTVNFNGKPLPGGTVVMTNAADTFSGTSYINESGQYIVRNAPAGPVLVTVRTDDLRNLPSPAMIKSMQARGIPITMPADPKERGTKFVPIPAKYGDKGTSGLTVEVKPDTEVEYPIELTGK